ncbi:MAG: glycosyltransferase family 4 protein [Clostridia bacterium]|nr:glycosyltransferase family 4 protein [Clostridia bacterium]
MKILIATDIRLVKFDNKYYASSQYFSILKRYYDAFGNITIISRCENVAELSTSCIEITNFIDEIIVVSSLAKVVLGRYNKLINNAIKSCDMLVARIPSFIAYTAYHFARKYNKKIYAELMGCAWDAFWNHSLAGKLLAPYAFFKMKKVAKNSNYTLYVTKNYLQKKYPCKGKTIGVSNVKISDISQEILEKRINKIENLDFSKELILTTTAAVNVRYKGQQFVIRAIPALNKLGIKVKYRLIGGGDNTYLLNLAKKLSVENQVEFVGRKPLDEVFKLLDETDIYIQPSLQEGLPRSVVEAMSRGCPALGARTAGIPELIANECVFKRKSPNAIVEAIQKIANKEKFIELATQNFKESKNYVETVLDKKRIGFYEKVKSND